VVEMLASFGTAEAPLKRGMNGAPDESDELDVWATRHPILWCQFGCGPPVLDLLLDNMPGVV